MAILNLNGVKEIKPVECVDIFLTDNILWNLFFIYVVPDDLQKKSLIAKLKNDMEIEKKEIVDLDLNLVTLDEIKGSAIYDEKKNSVSYSLPKWWKSEPFFIMVHNINELNLEEDPDLAKIERLILYLDYVRTPFTLFPRTFPKGSVMRSVILTKDFEKCKQVLLSLSTRCADNVRIKYIEMNEEGVWKVADREKGKG